MKNPVIYLVLNGELNMSPGKAAAQAVHAAMLLDTRAKEEFLSDHRRTVIVLEAKDAMQITNLFQYLKDTGISSNYYIDEGVNETGAYSLTSLAAGPLAADDEESRAIFAGLPLYGKKRSIMNIIMGRE